MGGFFSQDNPPPLEQAEGGTPPGNVVVQEPTGVDGATASFFGRGPSPQIQAFEEEAKQAAEAAAASAEEAEDAATAAAGSAQNALNTASGIETSVAVANAAKDQAQASATAAGQSATASQNSAASAATSAGQASTSASNAQTSAGAAATSSTQAASSAQNAATSATAAASSASNIQAAANTATTKAEEAATSATQAASSATAAAGSATNAASSVTASSTNATNAAASATSAAGSATTATTKAGEAATSATNAAGSATAAANSATGAAGSATTATTKASEAASSATSATGSATTATTKASEAAASATSAAGSATTATTKAAEASTSATNAAGSATAAGTSATAAGTSATNAANSATAAAGSATAAAGSATAASNSASSASGSATAASTAQTAAESARDATLAAFDSFDDRYLGVKTSNPTVDNDGNALAAGALYFNSTTAEMRVYTGTAWAAAYVSGAGVLLISNNLSDLASASAARTNLGLATVAASGAYADLTGKPTNVSSFTNDSGYLTSFTESDPTVPSHVKAITTTKISNWDTAFGWGNHASAGYLTGITSGQVTTALGYTPYNATNPAGYTTNTGTVTSVSGTGTVSGLTLTGSVTGSGSLTLGGTLSLTSGNVTTALGFTPYNATNPAGYITGITSGNVTTALGYTPANKAGDTFTGNVGIGVAPSGTYGKLAVAGGIRTTDDASSKLELGRYSSGAPSSYIKLGPNSGALRVTNSDDTVDILTLTNTGSLSAVADIRAPIFYDSNDTGYYFDGASTSNIYRINVNAGANVFDGGVVGPDPYGLLGITRRTDNNYSYLGFTRAGQHAMGMGIDTGNTFWIGGCSAGFNGVRSSSWLLMHSSGYVTAPVDMRSPLFYDSNDTAYFIDPNSTSVLSTVRAATVQHSSGNTAITLNDGTWTRFGDPNGVTKLWLGGTADPNNYYNANIHYFRNNGSGVAMTLDSAGNAIATASHRAPIFYDSNNTNYYVDGAGVSVLNSVASYTLRNIEDVSVDTQYGIYFSSNYSTSYAIFREAGAWSHPYPDLRIAFHTGIKIGAAAGYNGVRFYDNDNMVTQVMSVNNASDALGTGNVFVNYNLQAGSSLRAPIFYDSNDTGYYIDPNGTSMTNGMRSNVYRSLYGGGQPEARWDCSFYVLQAQHWYSHTGAQTMFVGESGDFVYIRGYTTAEGSSRSPIFYDSNNTGYYLDASGTGTSLQLAGNIDCIARSAAWSEGLRVRVPSRNTWGGIRFTRDEGNANGNWAIGFTGIDSTDDLTFWSNSGGAEGMRARLTQGGNFTASGNVTAYSDARLKQDVETVKNALDLVSKMRGVTYTRKDNGEAGVGVIAQEMREIMPQVIQQDGGEDGTLSVAYGNLVGVLIEAIKELQIEVETVKSRLH